MYLDNILKMHEKFQTGESDQPEYVDDVIASGIKG